MIFLNPAGRPSGPDPRLIEAMKKTRDRIKRLTRADCGTCNYVMEILDATLRWCETGPPQPDIAMGIPLLDALCAVHFTHVNGTHAEIELS